MAELTFSSYNHDENRHEVLHGDIISSLKGNHNSIVKMFDNKVDNYFSYPKEKGVWYGLDLKVPQTISQVGFAPRNDTNNIEPNNLYELFYWDKGWESLGKQRAKDNFLNYENVPKNSLFWLRNLTKGKEERIFTYDKGKQIWW